MKLKNNSQDLLSKLLVDIEQYHLNGSFQKILSKVDI